jgi:hypothetical protein
MRAGDMRRLESRLAALEKKMAPPVGSEFGVVGLYDLNRAMIAIVAVHAGKWNPMDP